MSVRHLILILGDQLDPQISSLQGANPAHDRILMVEAEEEGRYVQHHPQKILFILSAMRHFAEELRQQGFVVDYRRLGGTDNSGSLDGELARARQHWQPQAIRLSTGSGVGAGAGKPMSGPAVGCAKRILLMSSRGHRPDTLSRW